MFLALVQKFTNSNTERKIKINSKENRWEHFRGKLSVSEQRSPFSFEFVGNEVLATGQQVQIKNLRFENCGEYNKVIKMLLN